MVHGEQSQSTLLKENKTRAMEREKAGVGFDQFGKEMEGIEGKEGKKAK